MKKDIKNWREGLDFDPDKAIDASSRGCISQRFEVQFPGCKGIFQTSLPRDPLKPAYDFVVLFHKLPLDTTVDVELHTWDNEEGFGYPIIFSDEPMDSLEKGYQLARHLKVAFN